MGLCLFHLLHLLGHQRTFATILYLHIVLLPDEQPLKG